MLNEGGSESERELETRRGASQVLRLWRTDPSYVVVSNDNVVVCGLQMGLEEDEKVQMNISFHDHR